MYLGIDIGTSSVKAVLTKGKELHMDREEYQLFNIENEQNPLHIEEAIKKIVRRLITSGNHSAQEIRGISICGHGPSIVFINKHGIPLTNIITWQDKRADEEAQWLKCTYNNFHKDATSYEAKILWHFKHFPKLFSKGNTVLYPKDYIIHKLCSRKVIDKSAASTVYFFDTENSKWKFTQADIPENIFPEVVESTKEVDITGTEFSRLCNLPDGIPVYAGGIDAYCEALGAGAINPGDLIEGTGTSTCISLCQNIIPNLDLHVVPGLALVMKTISYSGGSIEWWNSISPIKDTRKLFKDINPNKPVNLLFLPYLMGERSPIWDEKATGVFFGLTNKTIYLDMLTAVMQGVAFAIKQNLKEIEKEYDTCNTIKAVGGGADNLQWLQIKANVTGKTYHKMRCTESAALGAAILAAAGRGDDSLDDIVSRWVKVDKEILPNKTASATYEKLYTIYEKLYPTLKDSFHQLANVT